MISYWTVSVELMGTSGNKPDTLHTEAEIGNVIFCDGVVTLKKLN